MRIYFFFCIIILSDVMIISYSQTQTSKSITLIKQMDSTTPSTSTLGPPPEDEEELPFSNNDVDNEKQKADLNLNTDDSSLIQKTLYLLANHFVFGKNNNQQEYNYKVKKWMACLLNTSSNKLEYFPLKKVTIVEKKEYSMMEKTLEINYFAQEKQMKGYLSDETCCVLSKPQQDNERFIRRFHLDSSNLIVLVDGSLIYITGNKKKDANHIISKKLWDKGFYIFSFVYSNGYFDEETNLIDYYSIFKNNGIIIYAVFISYICYYLIFTKKEKRKKKHYSSEDEDDDEDSTEGKKAQAEKKKVGRPKKTQ